MAVMGERSSLGAVSTPSAVSGVRSRFWMGTSSSYPFFATACADGTPHEIIRCSGSS